MNSFPNREGKRSLTAPMQLKRSKYRVLGLVGQGQFGQVYCAVHRRTGQLVALKNLDRYRFPTHRFLRELRFLLTLQHPNIVTCQALEHTATGRYLVMDYCEGGTLRQLIEGDVPLPVPQTLRLMMDVLAGLHHAHSHSIIHCDIKPENILLTLKPNAWKARISDFGIARLIQDAGTQYAGNTGSPAYMAPERFYGQYSSFSDIYAVGILLFELLVGQRPFSGTPQALMSAHLNQPVSFPDTLPIALQDIIQTALQKLPSRRFASAEAMREALQSIADEVHTWEPSSWRTPAVESAASPLCLFTPSASIDLEARVQQLQVLPPILAPVGLAPNCRQIIQVHETQAISRACSQELLAIGKDATLVTVPSLRSQPIQQVIPTTQGCWIVTSQAVDWLKASSLEGTSSAALRPVLSFERPILAAAHPTGTWIAAATQPSAEQSGLLTIAPMPPPDADCDRRITSVAYRSTKALQLLAIDQRHLALLSHDSRKATRPTEDTLSTQGKGTKFEIFTRRGTSLGALHIAVLLRQAIATTQPYRFLATEQDNPCAILLVDLKPFRAVRVLLRMTPVCFAAAPWGYILADAEGHLVLLNHHTDVVGQITGPAHPTAIASFNGSGLLIATWDGQQGQLHQIDLRKLPIDLLF